MRQHPGVEAIPNCVARLGVRELEREIGLGRESRAGARQKNARGGRGLQRRQRII